MRAFNKPTKTISVSKIMTDQFILQTKIAERRLDGNQKNRKSPRLSADCGLTGNFASILTTIILQYTYITTLTPVLHRGSHRLLEWSHLSKPQQTSHFSHLQNTHTRASTSNAGTKSSTPTETARTACNDIISCYLFVYPFVSSGLGIDTTMPDE